MSAKVSVIMPVFNSALYLRESVESILSQTFQDLELICVNDCSTDESLSILQSYTDSRLRIITQPTNGGVSTARNTALDAASGQFIAFLDSDDIAHPSRIEKQITFLETHPEADGVFARVRLVDVYGNPNGSWLDDELYLSEEEIKENIVERNCLSQPAACFRAEAMKQYRYSQAHPDSEDWAMWLRMLIDGKRLFKLDEALVDYRIRPSSETQRSNQSPIEKMIRFREIFLSQTPTHQHSTQYVTRMKKALKADRTNARKERYFRKPLRLVKKIVRANPPLLLWRWIQFALLLRKIHKYDRIFFFPFYHVGGAEKVHASVVNATSGKRNLVLFTKRSDNAGFLHLFQAHAHCVSIWEMCWYPGLKSYAAKALAKAIGKRKDVVLMSSNSIFFYQMLAHLPNDVCAIDLMHAFVHSEEPGPEKWSMPVLQKLQQRIFISQKAIDDAHAQYQKHQVQQDLFSRIRLVRNFVEIPSSSRTGALQPAPRLVYVGRGTAEKRVHLAAAVAKELGIRITMIGDVEQAVPAHLKPHCTFKGVLTEEAQVYRELAEADVLLLTSSREGLPMVIMEAMACGVIPICTAVGDLPNVLQHGTNGFLLPTVGEQKIIDSAVQAIRTLQTDGNKTAAMRLAARELATSMFDKARFTKTWNEILTVSE